MLRIISETIIGLGLLLGGCYTGYQYLQQLSNENNILLLGATIILAGSGIFLLVRAGKSDTTVIKKVDPSVTHGENQPDIASSGLNSILARNNAFAAEWNKTNNTKDQLKLLQISANAENQAQH